MQSNYLSKLLLVFVFFSFCGIASAQSDYILWYKLPADFFEECLVLGNGKMGAIVFGGVDSDKIYLNDITLWSGEPVNTNMNPEVYKNLPAIREALKDENYKLAEELNKKLQGKNSEAYQPLGTLEINNHNSGKVANYHRELDLSNAISKVTYEVDGIKLKLEYLVSAPDQIMVIKLTSSQKGALNFDINSSSLLKFKTEVKDNVLAMNGVAPINDHPGYQVLPSFLLEKERGKRFTNLMKIKSTDGKIVSSNTSLGLKEGTEALIYVSIATSFNGFDKNLASNGLNDIAIASTNLDKAFSKSYDKLKQSHIADYQKFYNRVTLNLGKTSAPDLPTDERLLLFSDGKEDNNLEIL